MIEVKGSLVPDGTISGDGVEGDEELSCDRDEGELGRLAGLSEALVELSERRVEARGGHRGQVQDGSHGGAATANPSSAPKCSAVSGEGCDADERCDFAAPQVTEFREIDQQRAGHAWTDTGDGLE